MGAWAGAVLLPQSYSEGADRPGVDGQLRGDKECPFNGVTNSGRVWRKVPETDARSHTPSIAFRHLPPNSARFGYATEGALFTPSIGFRHLPPNSARIGYATEGALFASTQLSTDAVSALRKVWVLIRLWKQPSAQAPT